ncbi:hypothetical protein FOZ63_021221 [Perkinsus olseni]|uniref:AAA+ ATPase domain-containing protein n=2 Tax=Perkinsus olseni TaxID=32597 RepID=A0A7J6T6X9_PEROL|nr:hypothetical protein FOZ63_021221 [Perkinsus olseni]
MATLTAVTVTRESWPRHSCLLSPIDLPEATAVLLEGTSNNHKICLWALRSRKVEAGRVELPSWSRKELGSEVSVSALSDQDDTPASWRLTIPHQAHWPDVLQAISLNPEVLRSAGERQLQQWPFLAQGHSVCLNLLGQSVKFTLEESELGGGLLAGFALPRSHSVTPPPPAKDCLYYNSPEDLRFADSLALSAFEILTFRPDRRSFTNLLHNLRPKAVTLLDVSHTPVNSEVCDGLWEACHRLRIPVLVVARDNLATVAGAWLSKFDKADMIDCSPVSEESTVSTSAAASVPCYGLDEQRKLLKEAVVFPFVYPNLYRQMGLRPSARVLVYGTSGSGKTTLIDSVLADFMPSRVSIVRVDVAGIFGKYLGSTERNLQRHFDAARLKLPAVLILDGLESIATAREDATEDDGTSGTYRRTLTTLLTCLDGVDADVEESLAVLATSTTPPDKLDPAVVRPGRFDKWIEVHRVADPDCIRAANEDLSQSETFLS